MNQSKNIAKHFREVYFGGNWTCSNLKDNLADVSWQEATRKIQNFNTIATLTFHMGYYLDVITKVLEGGPVEGKDELSFNTPPIGSQQDWEKLRNKTLTDAEKLAGLIEKIPESRLWEFFTEEKYGIYYRHLHGCIEHTHYHLGQIAILKKLIRNNSAE